jgi:MFS family permease
MADGELFPDTFLYGFTVPILPYMLEHRMGLDTSKMQSLTSIVLSWTALVSVISSPIVGNLMDGLGSKRLTRLPRRGDS